MWVGCGRVSDCEELVGLIKGGEGGTWETNFLPVRLDIRILVEKKLWRLERPNPRSYMAECRQKCRQMGSRASQALQLQGLRGARRGTRTPTPCGTRS